MMTVEVKVCGDNHDNNIYFESGWGAIDMKLQMLPECLKGKGVNADEKLYVTIPLTVSMLNDLHTATGTMLAALLEVQP